MCFRCLFVGYASYIASPIDSHKAKSCQTNKINVSSLLRDSQKFKYTSTTHLIFEAIALVVKKEQSPEQPIYNTRAGIVGRHNSHPSIIAYFDMVSIKWYAAQQEAD